MNIALQLVELNSSVVKINSCAFSDPSSFKLKIEINNLFRLIKSPVNTFLEDNLIPVPDQIGNIFSLNDLTLGYYDGYLYAGATPIFLAPTAAEVLQ